LFKKLSIQSSDIFSDFHPVPSDLTFAQAVELLEKQAQAEAGKADHSKQNDASVQQHNPQQKAEAKTQPLCCDR
jgi:topoisomerase IA-like protein